MASSPPAQTERDDAILLEQVACFPLYLQRGQTLFSPGDKFTYVYAVQSGVFKSFLLQHDGREQVSGFSMKGDVLGLDGLGTGRHDGGAIALGTSKVLAMPFAELESKARSNALLQRHVCGLFARGIVRSYYLMLTLGSMSSMERLVRFLIRASERCAEVGYSDSDFNFPMTRQDIASLLGMTIETVSRLFSALAREGVIEVNQKHIRIVDIEALRAMHRMRSGLSESPGPVMRPPEAPRAAAVL